MVKKRLLRINLLGDFLNSGSNLSKFAASYAMRDSLKHLSAKKKKGLVKLIIFHGTKESPKQRLKINCAWRIKHNNSHVIATFLIIIIIIHEIFLTLIFIHFF